MTLLRSAAGIAGFVVPLVLLAAPARAESDAPPPRVWGAGVAFGGGGSLGATIPFQWGKLPFVALPTLELQFFLPHEGSIRVSVPLVSILLDASSSKQIFFYNTDVLYDANVGTGSVRFVGGAGVGFSVLAGPGVAIASFRVPGEIGVEWLGAKNHLGIKLLARPWVEFLPQADFLLGGGVMGVLDVMGYITR